MSTGNILENVKVGTDYVVESGILQAALKSSFRLLIEHPFICLGGLIVVLATGVVLIKQFNDWGETSIQNFVFRAMFVRGMTIILVLALLFALDLGMISLQLDFFADLF